MKPTKKMQSALDRTRAAYKKLIENPIKEAEKWTDFGSFSACRFCRGAEVLEATATPERCISHSCPLVKMGDEDLTNPCYTPTLPDLYDSIVNSDYVLIKRYANARLEEIEKSAVECGYKLN